MSSPTGHVSLTAINPTSLLVGIEKLASENDRIAVSTEKNGENQAVPGTILSVETTSQALAQDQPALPSVNNTSQNHDSFHQNLTTSVTEEHSYPPIMAASEPSVDPPRQSAWVRFREAMAHDPLNKPEFVDAYNDWVKRNRKERYDRRRAWIVAHGCKLGALLGLVNKERSDEAWAAYQRKLAYMED